MADFRSNQSNSRTGSGFTNLQRIIDANKQNRLGTQVQTGIRSVAEDTRRQAQKQESLFQKESAENRLDTEANRQQREAAIAQAGQGQAPTEEQTGLFQRLREGVYKGPTGLQNFGQLQNTAQQTEALGRSAADSGGRQALLQRFVGGPGYSQGQQTFDTTLLGQQKKALENIRKASFGMARDIQGRELTAKNQAQEYQNRAKQFAEETNKQLIEQAKPTEEAATARGAAVTAEQEDLQKAAKDIQEFAGLRAPITNLRTSKGELATAPANKEAALDRIVDLALMKKFLTPAEEARLFKLRDRARDVGVNMAEQLGDKLRTEEAMNTGLQGAATAEEGARLNALYKLAGKDQLDTSKFGKIQKGRNYFDLDAIEQTITNAEASKANVMVPSGYTPSGSGEKPSFLQSVASVVTNPIGAVFCLFRDTPIRMADGSVKMVQDLRLGDDTFVGGIVTGTGQVLTPELVNFRGTLMSGRHAVFDNGVWVRAQDHKDSFAVTVDNELPIVYPIVTEYHLLVSEDKVLADYAETDQGTSVTDDERLAALNANIERNDALRELEGHLQNELNSVQQEAPLSESSASLG